MKEKYIKAFIIAFIVLFSFMLSYPIILSIKLNYSEIKNISLVTDFRAKILAEFIHVLYCTRFSQVFIHIFVYRQYMNI